MCIQKNVVIFSGRVTTLPKHFATFCCNCRVSVSPKGITRRQSEIEIAVSKVEIAVCEIEIAVSKVEIAVSELKLP